MSSNEIKFKSKLKAQLMICYDESNYQLKISLFFSDNCTTNIEILINFKIKFIF